MTGTLQTWLSRIDAGRLDLDTRLDPRDWRLPASPEQLQSVIQRLDAVVTMRMHGVVLALRAGVPAIALDPVEGGGKVTAQVRVLDWPAALDHQLEWCLSAGGTLAQRHARRSEQNRSQRVEAARRRTASWTAT